MNTKVSSADIKKLRKLSGAGMMDCKKALIEVDGNADKAVELLRKRGLLKAAKRMERQTGLGRIFSYIHGEGSIGVLLQLNCETDFVARNEEFAHLGHNLSLQVAASNPLAVKIEDIAPEIVEKERSILRAQLEQEGKKGEMLEKILEGKLKKFYTEICLQEQAYIKDPAVKIDELVREYISKFGENITIARFMRYQIH